MRYKNFLNEDNNPELQSNIRTIERYLEDLKKSLGDSSSQETILENAFFVAKYSIELFGNCNIDELSDRYMRSTYKSMTKELENTFKEYV